MDIKIICFGGILFTNDNNIPVQVNHASRYSIYVRIPENFEVRDGKSFNKLIIDTGERSFELSHCRFILDTNTGGLNGRLIFLEDLYNFDILFSQKELIDLRKLSNDLELILSQKEKVKDSFVKYVSNLTYDLKVYKNFFDELELTLAGEPEPIKETITQTLLKAEGRRFMDFFDKKIKELERTIENFSRNEHELHGFFLRKQVWDIIMCSEFMSRTNIKPRKYAGDSETMSMIYENSYKGSSLFSKILNKYPLEVHAAQAVRNRRIMAPEMLREMQREFSYKNRDPFKFMSIACGPAFELHDIFLSDTDASNLECTLLDQDPLAIQEASDNIKIIEKRIGYKIKVNYLRDSVRTMLQTKDLAKTWGRFHFIYSMGLFDYLTPPVARAVIEKIYSLLEPGGQILIGNYHIGNPSKWFMEYWLDWVLYYRSEDEFIDLLSNTDSEDLKIVWEDTNSQMFLTARKKSNES